MDFSDALLELKSGSSMSRLGWNAPDIYVTHKKPDYVEVNKGRLYCLAV